MTIEDGSFDEPEGEYVDYEDIPDDVIDTDDGGAIIRLDDGDEDDAAETEWFANLADGTVNETALNQLAQPLIDLIANDKTARAKRDEQYEDGLKRTGLANEAPGGAKFAGASKVVHPMLIEACIDFAARVMPELFPAAGPAKDFIPGKTTPEKLGKAKRKTQLMNYQLTVQCPEFRSELEQLLTQLPLGGSQYLKVGFNTRKHKIDPLFIAIDDMLLPYAATNFYSAHRKTHVQYITQAEYESRVKDGMYRDVELVSEVMIPELTKAGEASDKIEGRDAGSYNEDGLRVVLECYTTLDIEEDGKVEGPAPYIITIDKATGRVLSLYRAWDEDDEGMEELLDIVEFPFVPWRGAYAIGLSHMIGMLSGAATGALRALLDSAHINNTAAMLKLKGKVGGQNINIEPTSVTEIESGPMIDDIRKLAMPLPFNPPSVVLFDLLGFLVDAGRGVVRTALENTADFNPNAPVGTTLANIEQGLVVYKAIHGRLHASMERVLKVVHRHNAKHLDPSKLTEEVGEELAAPADFQGPMDVVPVSDPNIFSETQRFAQVQSVVQRADMHPELYDARKVEERVLETLKIPNADELLLPPVSPKEQNAINENAAAALGRPITAFPEQDHSAHLTTHLGFLQSPLFGQNPTIAPTLLPAMLGHIREHLVLWYVARVFDVSSEAMGTDLGAFMGDLEKDPESRKALDQLLAEAGTLSITDAEADQQLAEIGQLLPQLQQMAQQFMPPPPMDPMAIEAKRVENEGKATDGMLAAQQSKDQIAQQGLQLKAQTEQSKLAQKAEELRNKYLNEEQKRAFDERKQKLDLMTKVAMNNADNETAEDIAFRRDEQAAQLQRESAEQQALLHFDNADRQDRNAAEDRATNITIKGSGFDPNPNPGQ